MSKFISTLVIAALLLTGTAAVVPVDPALDAPAVTKNTPSETISKTLTATEAEAVALNRAALTEADVTGLHSEYDIDYGIPHYDVEFRSGDHEYDYVIHAVSGEVLKEDKEYDPAKTRPAATEPPATEPPVTEPPATQPPATEPPATEPVVTELTKEEALAIALKHAGLTESDISGLRSEYDRDDGVTEWDIEFRSGDYEYDYSVNSRTGEIRKRDKEYDPPKVKQTTQTEPPATEPPATEPADEKLTKDEAIAIALAHAGLTSDQVKGLRGEYDVDDGRPEWEVEFRSGRTEYEYTIHAKTGKILEWDKDTDD